MSPVATRLLLTGAALVFAECAWSARSPSGAATPPALPLENTYWRLTEVRGQSAVVADDVREAHLRFAADSVGGGRVAGSTGCNRLSGPYTRNGAELRIDPAATTRMACADPALAAQEQALLAVLTATASHTIVGDVLTLSGADGSLARFIATALQ